MIYFADQSRPLPSRLSEVETAVEIASRTSPHWLLRGCGRASQPGIGSELKVAIDPPRHKNV